MKTPNFDSFKYAASGLGRSLAGIAMWNRRRLAGVGIGLLVTIFVIARTTGGHANHAPRAGAAPSGSGVITVAPSGSALPTVTAAPSATVKPGATVAGRSTVDPGVISASVKFVAAWANTGVAPDGSVTKVVTKPQWMSGLTACKCVSGRLLAQFTSTDPSNVPVQLPITGVVRYASTEGNDTVLVTVPTSSYTLVLTVVRYRAAAWVVDRVDVQA